MIYPLKCSCGRRVEVFRSLEERNDPYPCDCGKTMIRDYAAQNVTSTPFFDGAVVFKDGRKVKMESMREVKDHCARNGLVMGGDDIEQEAVKNKRVKEQAEAEVVSEKVMDDFKRLQKKKAEGRVKEFVPNTSLPQ